TPFRGTPRCSCFRCVWHRFPLWDRIHDGFDNVCFCLSCGLPGSICNGRRVICTICRQKDRRPSMFKGTVLATLVAEKALRSECQARSERVVKPEVVQPSGLAELRSKLFR